MEVKGLVCRHRTFTPMLSGQVLGKRPWMVSLGRWSPALLLPLAERTLCGAILTCPEGNGALGLPGVPAKLERTGILASDSFSTRMYLVSGTGFVHSPDDVERFPIYPASVLTSGKWESQKQC